MNSCFKRKVKKPSMLLRIKQRQDGSVVYIFLDGISQPTSLWSSYEGPVQFVNRSRRFQVLTEGFMISPLFQNGIKGNEINKVKLSGKNILENYR